MDRVFITVCGINIYWYSIMILLGAIFGSLVVFKEAKREKLNKIVEDMLFYLIIIGILGARIYYVIFNFKVYKYDLLSIFKIWEGGLAIYGGVIAGILVIYYYAKKNKISFYKLTDICAPGIIIAQAIGRWGNFFNQEAHGKEVSLTFLKSLHLPKFIIDGMYINGTYYHPTFLYESVACLIGFIILLLIRKYTKRKERVVTYSYFIWYGLIRFFIEGLRTDSLYLGSFRISQIVSIILVVVGVCGLINIIKKRKEVKNGK